MKAQICYACHMVRACKRCCRTCSNECNCRHDCSLRMTETAGWQWYDAVTSVMKEEFALAYVPEDIRRKVEAMRGKPIQLTIDFKP